MFCSRCGAQIQEGGNFCTRCGSPVSVPPQTPAQQVPPQQPVYYNPPVQNYQQPQQPAAYVPPVQPQPISYASVAPVCQQPFSQEDPAKMARVREAVRKVGGSPLFLIAVICFTLLQCFFWLFGGNFTGQLRSEIFTFLNYFDVYNKRIQDICYFLSGDIIDTIALLTNVFVLAGLWIIYISARCKSNNTVGLTMIKVISIIQLVGILLLAVLIMLPTALFMLDIDDYRPLRELEYLGLAMLIMVLEGMCALTIVFYVRFLCVIRAVKKSLRTGISYRNISVFVAVICFMLGLYVALNELTFLTSYNIFRILEAGSLMFILQTFLSVMASLLSVMSLFLFGILIFVYRGKLARAEKEEVKPVAVAEPRNEVCDELPAEVGAAEENS